MRSTAERGRLELRPGLWLDARRAVYLETEATIAVADPHLGYAWAQRHAGNLLPLADDRELEMNLAELLEDYAPRQVVVLGDFVHRAIALDGIRDQICRFIDTVEMRSRLVLLNGNHDRGLHEVLRQCARNVATAREMVCGEYTLLHGHEDVTCDRTVLMGHEHPVIALPDGTGGRVKCPCFLIGARTIVLPAHSPWAAGSDIRKRDFLSAVARRETFVRAIAVLGRKLLPVTLIDPA